MGLSAMNQWIEMTEYIFQRKLEQDERKKIMWYLPVKQVHSQNKNDTIKKMGDKITEPILEKDHLTKNN